LPCSALKIESQSLRLNTKIQTFDNYYFDEYLKEMTRMFRPAIASITDGDIVV
jgi:hypothetical protein